MYKVYFKSGKLFISTNEVDGDEIKSFASLDEAKKELRSLLYELI